MKRLSFLLAIVMLVSACNLSAQKSTISGSIADLPEGSKVVLAAIVGDQINADTLQLDAKGAFKTTINPTEPTLYMVNILPFNATACHLMVGPKEKIEVDMVYIPEMRTAKITHCKGSDNVELYRQFNDILLSGVNPTMQALIPSQLESLLAQNKNVLISSFLVTIFEQDFENHAFLYKEIRDALAPKYENNPYVKHLSDRLRGLLLPGMEAPEIAMPDTEGNTRKLSDLRGKVVMIDFWASWCGPCRKENPNVVKLYHKYHDKGFEIYSVSLDKTRDQWLKAIKDDGLVWPNHVSDLNGWTSSGGKTYGIMSVPSTVLIDKEGKIIARNLRGAELERKLAEIFN
ncbi:MAG: TlpA family protein disulfide reductase [Bacteroidales bacterium]|nr:TlpA family protein disulfide reductase [Bacteroidales bacterium]